MKESYSLRVVNKIRKSGEESGIALLLSIFVLLLICVVGIAMIVASGTESSLSGNYRSSTAAYYAALSGLEEGRGRLLPKNPNYLGPYLPPPGTPLALGHVIYIINSLPSPEPPVDPLDFSNPKSYPDNEYAIEFPTHNPPSIIQRVPSVLSLSGYPNPLYKWVRINSIAESSQNLDVNGNFVGLNTPIFFDGSNLNLTNQGFPVLGVTALAGLPDGSQKMMQYIVAPDTLHLKFYSALTLTSAGVPGNGVAFTQPPDPDSFDLNGHDQCGAKPDVSGFGVLNSYDLARVHIAIDAPHPNHYKGTGLTPSVTDVSGFAPAIPGNTQDPAQLNNLVQQIQGSADAVIAGPANESSMPGGMSPSSPKTVVVNGDLSIGDFTGYGLLVVTGNLSYTGESRWRGIVLVIGQGNVTESGSDDGGEFDGAFYVAKTLDTGGNPLASLGPATFTLASPGGDGIRYNSCWIDAVQKPIKYKILSFHEIPQP